MTHIIFGVATVIGLIVAIVWLLRPTKRERLPTLDEYWAAREADERSRRGTDG